MPPRPGSLVQQRPRLVLFSVALVVRLFCATISFGSIDLINAIQVTPAQLANQPLLEVPYLPAVSVFISLSGALSLLTPLPIALLYKLFPILFDCGLAVLIHDVLLRRAPRQAVAAGLLYALSPVALLIVCFQGQWDSMWFFFVVLAFHVREHFSGSHGKYVLFGALFAVAVLFKPVALVLLPFFFTPEGLGRSLFRSRSDQLSVAGLLGVLAVAFAVFGLAGYSPIERVQTIAAYSSRGVVMLGLPLAYPLDHVPLLRSRAWLVVVVGALALPYARRRLDGFTAAVAAFLLVLGLAGLSPQYLFWPVPFLLLSRRLVMAAFYNVLVGVFLLLFYLNPMASYYAGENMATFALLEPLAWAMPPASWTDDNLLMLVRLLGNYVIPLFALAAVGRILWQALRRGPGEVEPAPLGGEPLSSLWPGYGRVLVFGGLAVIAARLLLSLRPDLPEAFSLEFISARIHAYHLQVVWWNEMTLLVGRYPESNVLHLGWLVLLGALAWSIAAVLLADRPGRGGAEGEAKVEERGPGEVQAAVPCAAGH
jgi:hypothetical protein